TPFNSLYPLSFGNRRSEAHRNIIGEMTAADGKDRSMAHRVSIDNGQVGDVRADVDYRGPKLLFVRGERCFGDRDVIDHRIGYHHAGAVHRCNHILPGGYRRRDNVNRCLKPDSQKTYWISDTVLAVDREFLGKDVDDLSIGWYADRSGLVNYTIHVLFIDFAVSTAYCDDSPRIEPLDLDTAQPNVDLIDWQPAHHLGFFNGALDCLHGSFDVDDHSLSHAPGLGPADPDDLHLVIFSCFARDQPDLRGAYVERGYIPISFRHRDSPVQCFFPGALLNWESCLESSAASGPAKFRTIRSDRATSMNDTGFGLRAAASAS